jgi:pyruvate/2-oxoglutarate/acetoin dehydrogenase E1 component
LLYSRKAPVPAEDYLVPIGVADVKREGDDVTVVAAGAATHLALQAARQLAREGVELEVVDPRTLKPLDIDAIAASVSKTGRLVVVNEGARAGGFASEVVARTLDHVPISDLRATPVRVTAKDTPMPYSASLEREVLPSLDDVLAAVAQVMRD